MSDQFDPNEVPAEVKAGDEAADLEKTRRWHQLVVKAWKDPAFMAVLLQSPSDLLREEGVLDQGQHVSVIVQNAGAKVLVLPALPDGVDPAMIEVPPLNADPKAYFEKLPAILQRPGSGTCAIPGGCSWMS